MPANRAVNGVGIVTAMVAEARFLGAKVSRQQPRASLPDGTLVQVGGIGPEAAARCAGHLVTAGVAALASWGMAGGLDPALPAGTVLLPEHILSPEGGLLPTSPSWRERLTAAISPHGPLAHGTLWTSPRAVESVADKARAFGQTGAAAVDMESAAVAQVAAAHGLPFIALRVIIDSAHDALPRTVMAAMTPSGDVQVLRLLAALAIAPADVMALLRLAQRYRVAGRALTGIARTGSLSASAFPGWAPATIS